MTKYNKSEIMKKAWSSYKAGQAWNGAKESFAECLKMEWSIAKKNAIIEAETVRYFNEVCINAIKNGEDAVDDAFRTYRNESHKEMMSMTTEEVLKAQPTFQARMRAWKAAVAVFRSIAHTFSTELVNSQIMSEIQDLDVA